MAGTLEYELLNKNLEMVDGHAVKAPEDYQNPEQLYEALIAILGMLIVTTPTEPVLSPLPKNPPDFLRSSRRSRRRRQHILRTSLGSISLLM